MIEILPNLYIGNEDDYYQLTKSPDFSEWYVIQAAKDPFHREALGYETRGAPVRDPEYLRAYRNGRMILNLVDGPAAFFREDLVREALQVIRQHLDHGDRVLVHCNQGESRAPTLGLLYMVREGYLPNHYQEAMEEYVEIYPRYEPKEGIEQFASRLIESGRLGRKGEIPHGGPVPQDHSTPPSQET